MYTKEHWYSRQALDQQGDWISEVNGFQFNVEVGLINMCVLEVMASIQRLGINSRVKATCQ